MSSMDKQGPKPSEILFPGRVTQVIDPHYFWMQMGSAERLACFLKIQQDMQLYCESHWSSVADADSIVIGQLVLVDTGQSDIRWRRGQVSRISSDSADIFYIDYGSTEVATLENICVEFPPIVRSVPPMAVRCCLAGIKPIKYATTESWKKDEVKMGNICAECRGKYDDGRDKTEGRASLKTENQDILQVHLAAKNSANNLPNNLPNS